MNIVILHYHLNRGGVTRVIANHLLALDAQAEPGERYRVAVLYGGRDAGWPHELAERLQRVELSLHAVESLDYDPQPVAHPAALAEKLQTVFTQLDFQPDNTLLHVHNHNLGKNASLPGALKLLAAAGYAQLRQIHDFAEDFRPRNYQLLCETFGRENVPAELYPHEGHVHYAVLNRRDHSILRDAGVPAGQLHFLPNSVPAHGNLPDRDQARRKLHQQLGVSPSDRYVLYPVRGIRRKNVGEALLWSLLAGEGTTTAITLAPLNPAEQTAYRRWQSVANELNASFEFASGEAGGLSFEENLAASDLILTTSIAEGFGMVFLEAWLAGRALTGRNLPEITVDFTDVGIQFPLLYERLDIPLDWIGRDRLTAALESGLANVLQSYGLLSPDSSEWDDIVSQKIQQQSVDFGDLNESLQENVIRRVATDDDARLQLLELNPTIRQSSKESSAVIESNRRRITEHYALKPTGQRLAEVYRTTMSATSTEDDNPTKGDHPILQKFLDPARYRLIRG